MRYNKDNMQLMALYEATRRDILKKGSGTIASTLMPAPAVASASKRIVYDISRLKNSDNDKVRKALSHFQQGKMTKKIIEFLIASDYWDNVTDRDDNDNNVHIVTKMVNDAEQYIANQYEKAAYSKFGQKNQIFDDYFQEDLFSAIENFYEEYLYGYGDNPIKDLINLIPAGDIKIDGKVIVTSEQLLQQGILQSFEQCQKNMESLMQKSLNDFLTDPESYAEEVYNRIKNDIKDKEAKEYSGSIKYSPFDYRGADYETQKLAMDSKQIYF